ncbi:uncharacterized protein CC84DRAFT_1162843 [Paraphaeosphaeria sporulosa]|uniref:Uncharacterized protein n=1 Tax=Paraphaeosphaeria sporulosa TaxID=1460663 RepID=A0A177CNH7_9PLEO|nr:uncharacterized protein CC84DRAFT_1162843 [Paraphaeosphaeria sporulosa]OAG09054.1 hypothetical protein CC84DRAFT_1162843 [Paraphaeosphaeria sporulosa]
MSNWSAAVSVPAETVHGSYSTLGANVMNLVYTSQLIFWSFILTQTTVGYIGQESLYG